MTRPLQLGDPCPDCGGSGKVAHPMHVAWHHGMLDKYHRLVWVDCTTCAHVRTEQRRLNRDAAARLAHGIRSWFMYDEHTGAPFLSCSYPDWIARRCTRGDGLGVEDSEARPRPVRVHSSGVTRCEPKRW